MFNLQNGVTKWVNRKRGEREKAECRDIDREAADRSLLDYNWIFQQPNQITSRLCFCRVCFAACPSLDILKLIVLTVYCIGFPACVGIMIAHGHIHRMGICAGAEANSNTHKQSRHRSLFLLLNRRFFSPLLSLLFILDIYIQRKSIHADK